MTRGRAATDIWDARAARAGTQWDRVRRKASVNAVHDLRVALRRLEEVTRLFAPLLPDRAARRLRRRSRSIRWRLGPVRSADVVAELLAEVERSAPRVLKTSARRLRRGALERAQGLRDGHGIALAELAHRVERVRRKIPHDGAALRRCAARGLAARVAEAVKARRASARGAKDALHDLRIAARRIRYALEAIAEMGCTGTRGAIARARTLQAHLGRLRDEELLRAWVLRSGPPAVDPALRSFLRLRVEKARRVAQNAAAGFRPEKDLVRVSRALGQDQQ